MGIGLDTIRNFAEEEGVKCEISKRGITEREAQELVELFRNKEADSRRGNESGARSEESKGKIREILDTDKEKGST